MPSTMLILARGDLAVVLNLNSGTLKHLVVGGGKDGNLYVLNGDAMGGLGRLERSAALFCWWRHLCHRSFLQ